MRLKAAIFIVKIITHILTFFGSGGTSLPGKIGLKICPNALSLMKDHFTVIIVTGTNGKTTTARMIAAGLLQSGFSYVTNRAGANLKSGVSTTLFNAMSLCKKSAVPYALIESDEAAFRHIAAELQPAYIVVTNFFRDQLDRYGELLSTLNHVKAGISKSPESVLLLNADDPYCVSIAKDFQNHSVFFGINQGAPSIKGNDELLDGRFCVYCKHEYAYTQRSYGHLGHFHCPNCGFERPNPTVYVDCVPLLKHDKTVAKVVVINRAQEKETHTLTLPVPGFYNLYNALAALAYFQAADQSMECSVKVLFNFEPGFGRLENFVVDGKNVRVILVKNPVGFDRALEIMSSHHEVSGAAFVINDNIADGTDISWLWDVDFESMLKKDMKVLFASGQRAEDMALRLKYAQFTDQSIFVEKQYEKLLDKGLSMTEKSEYFYVFPTYTALLRFRKVIAKKMGKRNDRLQRKEFRYE